MLGVLLVFLGGGVGSVARYVLSRVLGGFFPMVFPLGTFVVNVLGCFLLGFLVVSLSKWGGGSKEFYLLLATGFCGGFTTFSTFMYENQSFLLSGSYGWLLVYVGLSLFGGVLGMSLGLRLGSIVG